MSVGRLLSRTRLHVCTRASLVYFGSITCVSETGVAGENCRRESICVYLVSAIMNETVKCDRRRSLIPFFRNLAVRFLPVTYIRLDGNIRMPLAGPGPCRALVGPTNSSWSCPPKKSSLQPNP